MYLFDIRITKALKAIGDASTHARNLSCIKNCIVVLFQKTTVEQLELFMYEVCSSHCEVTNIICNTMVHTPCETVF